MRASRELHVLTAGDPKDPIGITLVGDFCAEHEAGTHPLQASLGLPDWETAQAQRMFGFERITAAPDPDRSGIHLYDEDGVVALVLTNEAFGRSLNKPAKFKSFLELSDLRLGHRTTQSAWDEYGLGVVSRDPFIQDLLRRLYMGLFRGDVVVTQTNLSPSNPFSPAGVTVALKSKIPEQVEKHFRDRAEDQFNLLASAEATGIAKTLSDAGKHWYSLRPAWAKDNARIQTDHAVVFFLNPTEQDRHEANWFSVEDLLLRAKGKGPVMKERA